MDQLAIRERRGREHPVGRLCLLACTAALVTAACATEAPPLPTSPPLPPGWSIVDGGDLSLALPPWLVPFDTTGAIFANELPDPESHWVQLMAQGPRTAELQPAAGEALDHWLLARLASPVAGQPVIGHIELPAGAATIVERLDARGTPSEWRIAAYGIRTRFGVAFLQIDGPPDAWVGHEEDVAQIPLFIQVGPGPPLPRSSSP